MFLLKTLLLYNPSAGKGRARAVAERLADALNAHGFEAALREVGPNGDHDRRVEALRAVDRAVVVGGDGTVHHLLSDLIEGGAPLYHAPLGTENLLAREFSMRPDAPAVIDALRRNDVQRLDVARFGERRLLLMCSCGYDAAVIHRLHAGRKRRISHRSYIRPMLQEAVQWRPPRLLVTDGERTIVNGEQGMLVIANSRQYAMRLNPARDADMSDGQLDLIFYPARTRAGLARWSLLTALGQHLGRRSLIRARASHFTVESLSPHAQFQLDGEPHLADGHGAGQSRTFEVTISQAALPVLA